MKKIIFLMLVVGTASVANAMTLKITTDFHAATLDIVDTEGYTVGDDIYWALVGNSSKIIFSGGSVVAGVAPTDSGIYGYNAQSVGFCSAPYDGVWGFIGDIAGQATGPGTYIDEINWILVGGTTVYSDWLALIGTTDFAAFTILWEIPEPMTLALLGLGGLMLLRQRRR